ETDSTDDEKKPESNKGPATVTIDLDGISNRIIALPVTGRFIGSMDGSVSGKIIYSNGGEIFMFDLKTMKETSLVTNAGSFRISADGKKMVYQSRGNYFVVDAGKKPSNDEGRLTLTGIK